MNIQQGTIYVDGQPVKTKYCMFNSNLMVPSLFFKYAGLYVDWDLINKLIIFKKNNNMLILPMFSDCTHYHVKDYDQPQKEIPNNNTMKTYIPLQFVANEFGMTVFYYGKKSQIHLLTNILPLMKPQIVSRVETYKKKVALTFDDGPDDDATPKILDILRDKEVPATFFVEGEQVQLFPKQLQRITTEGHQIGNHSWSHRDFTKITTCEVINEIKKAERLINCITGIKTKIFRPPYGSFTDAELNVINHLGLEAIGWDVDTKDWSGKSADEILKIVAKDACPGSIILQHSLQFTPGILDGTIKALPHIIDLLRFQGMELVTIDNLFNNFTC